MDAIRATGLSMLLVAQAASGAGSLRVAPTRLELPPDRRAVAVTVTNTGSAPTLLQLEPKHWSQDAGTDDYTAASDLIVSPPIFTLDAGAEQVVRIARREGASLSREVAWRLFIQEVPTPGSTAPRELNVVLRIGVPVFATPAHAPEAALEWHLQCLDASPPVLLALNRGGRALRIDELSVRVGGADHTERAVYILAGATRMLSLKDLPEATRRVELTGHSGQQQISGSAACN
jgi:fimbrial chaperone protein